MLVMVANSTIQARVYKVLVHRINFIEHQKLDSFKYSFVPRTTQDWDNLPSNITVTTGTVLKQARVFWY
jgi:hypothetical protein